MSTPAVRQSATIVRPLKILVPLIQVELQQGDQAGHEHYRVAGEMLIEAKSQLAHGAWGRWLTKHFALSGHTAARYMRWARMHNGPPRSEVPPASLYEMRGGTARDREHRDAERGFRKVLREVARDDFAQERQAHDEEIRLHRELAEELVDLGYRALATRLHPDRGGSKDAMARLNRVREELKSLAQTRRFV